MVFKRLLCGVAAVVMLSSSGQAAEVFNRAGKVSINTGNGYVAVVGTTYGRPGDIVIAHPGGRGEIVYVDGCRQAVEPGQTEMIALESPCRTGYGPVMREPWGMALALGATTGAVIYFATKDDDKPKSP